MLSTANMRPEVVLCAALLLTACTGLEAECRCKFAQLKLQLNTMHATESSDFEKISSFMEGLTILDDVLFTNGGSFVGYCDRISSCNASILHDLLDVNLQLLTSAGRSALAHLPQLSVAVKIIESNFYYFDNYIKELARLRPGHTEFQFEFKQEQERLHNAMKSVCFVSNRTSENANQPTPELSEIVRQTRCEPQDYLPICFKLHSAALQFLLMLQSYSDLSSINPKHWSNVQEFAYYNNFRHKLIGSIDYCRTKRVKTVVKSESQSKLEFQLTGIVSFSIVLLIIILAVALAIWMATNRQRTNRAGFDRVVTNSEGYHYETGFV
ncbi:hypothetical protein BOX15_Mlig004256g1 [Macrostomum lignano]|uniref:Uncharacterized protein n=1 Tax=Macrostomum lignano TaxID=282301 RepID=A0A267F3I2_9PLAT|nr:hypothetical protein BOX15_Mlig004256g1 [Macrostomum lignano]